MKKIILNQASLKLIAMGLMLLDHIYKIFCFDVRDFLLVHTTLTQEAIQWGIQLIGMLGAASFWIFAFFIAEGCRRTHNRSAYLIRLLIMGLISEIPFQYMICILLDAPLTLHFALTNIFFTLFLGAAAIMAYDAFRSRQTLQKLSLLSLPLCMLIAYVLQTDYGALGVLAIFVCYCGSDEYRLYRLGGVILLEASTLLIQGQSLQADDLLYAFLYILYASLSLPLLSCYNGKKGALPKWLFYTFYPLHITILVVLYITA